MSGNDTNIPLSAANIALTHIETSSSRATQTAQLANGAATYVRYRNGNVWSTWRKIWIDSDFTSTDITNWNNTYTNFITSGWGLGIQNNAVYTGDVFAITTSQVVRVANSATNLPSNQNGFLVSYYRSSVYASLTFYADNGETWYNTKNGAPYGTWKRIWTNADFTSTAVTNWNTVYNDRTNYLRNQADGTTGGLLTQSSISDANNLVTGVAYLNGLTANLPTTTSFHVTSLAGQSGYAAQTAIRNSNFYFRTQENSTWQPWKKIWNEGDFNSSDITNWNTAYNNYLPII